jgi:hypothetical protein
VVEPNRLKKIKKYRQCAFSDFLFGVKREKVKKKTLMDVGFLAD